MQGLFHPHVLLISFLVHGSFQDTNHKENVLHWFLGMMGCYSTNGKQESEILKFWIGPQNLENSLSGLFLFQKIRYWFPKPRVKPKKKKQQMELGVKYWLDPKRILELWIVHLRYLGNQKAVDIYPLLPDKKHRNKQDPQVLLCPT